MLLGRHRERQGIERVLASARSGRSAALALSGEPGIGKTALLEYAAQRAQGMQVLRARGVESEAEIPFASLLELLRPALSMIDRIPEPQSMALEGALALRPAQALERFAVGAATLSLLAAYAEQGPVAVLIDDAHWLDVPSAQALLFAVRRLVADPIAVVISVRDGEPSLLDGADLPMLELEGLSKDEATLLLPDLSRDATERLHEATGGNPLALLELSPEAGGDELAFAPAGAPVVVPATVSRAFLRRADQLGTDVGRALLLCAASGSAEIATLVPAAKKLGTDLDALATAEAAGLVTLRAGRVEFRHPLARSAIYAQAPAEQRRAVHRAIASALPDKDVDRRAWHLAAAAIGTDEAASVALQQAAIRALDRSAYATAAAAFARAARLTADAERRAGLLLRGAEAALLAGLADRASVLIDESRNHTRDAVRLVEADRLEGYILIRRGPVMKAHAILTEAARRAEPELAIVMLAEAAGACFIAAEPEEMARTAARARAVLPPNASAAARFLATMASGMASILGGDAETGAAAIRDALPLAGASELRDDTTLLPWLVFPVVFLRESADRELIDQALDAARERSAVGTLPALLNLVARDQATSDRWALAESTYTESIGLARETRQQADLAFGLAGLAWLFARQGREQECRRAAQEALELNREIGAGLYEIWVIAASGELELALGQAARAAELFEQQQLLLRRAGITDVDLSPAAEIVEAQIRLGNLEQAREVALEFEQAAIAKAQPWSLARAARCRALLADEGEMTSAFDRALELHTRTPDAFEAARTRLAYGARLRRSRQRILAREQLRLALKSFEELTAWPWADLARSELAASGETLRRRDPTSIEELTPQELQIGLLLAGGKTTREAAAALFLSPKTVEYHLRHVYRKLDISSREELAAALGDRGERPAAAATAPSAASAPPTRAGAV